MMNNELLLLIKKHIDTLIEQKKSHPQETLEFSMNNQTETFPFSLPISLTNERKSLLGVTFFQTTYTVFNITDQNNCLSISIPGHWRIHNYLEDRVFDKLKN